MTSVKEEDTVKLRVCRICLATDIKMYSIQEQGLHQAFINIMGIPFSVWDGFPQYLCYLCKALLFKSIELRTRCHQTQAILRQALVHQKFLTMEFIHTIDRVAQKLTLNLKIHEVVQTLYEPNTVKLEDIKVETCELMENIFINETQVPNDDYFDSDSHYDKEILQIVNDTVKREKVKVKRKTFKKEKIRKKHKNKLVIKETDSNISEQKICKRKLQDAGQMKRIIKRRKADNDFLPDFNFDEFQSKYNVKIDILSKEEQLREIEQKKLSPTFTNAAFGCEICGKEVATKQVFDVHMMKHNVSSGAHACEICQVRFKTRSRVHVHQDTHRLRFTCAQCGFTTRTRFIAKNHFLSHAGTTHKCPHCEAIFNKYTSYLTHVRRRHPAMNTACDECGETFVGPNGLRHHKTRIHTNRKLLKPPCQHECSHCNVQFASAEALQRHSGAMSETTCQPSTRPCLQCGENFTDENSLNTHADEYHSRKHSCLECKKTFIDKSSYDTHYQRVHLNIRMKEPPRAKSKFARAFICEVCGNECTSLTNLVSHQRSHSGVKPHACPACPLRFSSVHNMQRHHRVVHLGQRPQVKCNICGKLLAHASSLKLHVSSVHLKTPPPPRQRQRKTQVANNYTNK